jgi:predicted MFS family arabinose efflux permease
MTHTQATATTQDAVPDSGEQSPRSPLPYFLTLVFFVSAFNQGDRLLIGIVAQPIKLEFGLSDTMMGLLSGTVFALVYPPLGLPIAWFADRFNRKNILSICLAFWSGMTAFAGFATSYPQLVLARLGVAAGEAGFVPPTHSLIADYVSEARRARAFSILAAGAAAGILIANVVGGALTDAYGWRAAFIAMGLPGVGLALLIALTMKEPPRAAPKPRVAGEKRGSVVLRLARNPIFSLCVMGSAFHLMYQYAAAAWSATFYVRAFEANLFEAGLLVGVGGAIAAGLGGVAGGFVGDWVALRDRRWLAFWPALTVAIAAPIGAAGFLANEVWLVFGCLLVATFSNALYQSSTYSLIQSQAGGGERATAAALMIFIQNLLGLGLGPVLVGALSDGLTVEFGTRALGVAMAAANGFNLIAAAFFIAAGFRMTHAPLIAPKEGAHA